MLDGKLLYAWLELLVKELEIIVLQKLFSIGLGFDISHSKDCIYADNLDEKYSVPTDYHVEHVKEKL